MERCEAAHDGCDKMLVIRPTVCNVISSLIGCSLRVSASHPSPQPPLRGALSVLAPVDMIIRVRALQHWENRKWEDERRGGVKICRGRESKEGEEKEKRRITSRVEEIMRGQGRRKRGGRIATDTTVWSRSRWRCAGAAAEAPTRAKGIPQPRIWRMCERYDIT